ncbi:MAG: PASTA domain-containing protein [Erysipelotrichaceae bacterium]|nr:PASTA domain-containing protein [Erysipelotrichaceae bacterium]
MPEEKNFLDQFSNSGKPASFEEEKRIPVTKERKPVNWKLLIILLVAALLLGVLAYFLFLAPKIVMPDFEGKTKSDVGAWVKQQGIEPSGIIFQESYDFDTEEGTILTQSIPAGKKVRKDVKLNFDLSLGPDPEEKIKVPDFYSMDKDSIQEWITKNKLSKTRLITAYSDTVAEDEVIDYQFTGCDEDTFTRGSTLKINVSKGSAPAGKVTVEDFEKKIYESAESWAKAHKINLVKTEVYSDKIDAGYIVSQSIPSGRTINEGDTLEVVVSKGKAVFMPNMVGWDEHQLDSWISENPGIRVYREEYYSDYAKGVVISQNVAAKSLLGDNDYIELKISLGNIVELPSSYVGQTYHDYGGLHDWKDKQNELGANITIERTFEFSDTVPAKAIIRHDMEVEVGGTLHVVVSKGRNVLLKDGEVTWVDLAKGNNVTEEQARQLCIDNEVTYEIKYSYDASRPNGYVIYAQRWDNLTIKAGTYLPQDIILYVYINDLSMKP